MDVQFTMHIVKCPNCGNPIRLNIGKYVGGINDRGGAVLQCSECGRRFPCNMKNPKDLSTVSKGGEILETWYDDYPDYLNDKYNISQGELLTAERAVVFGYEKPAKVVWHPSPISPMYTYKDVNFEVQATNYLGKYEKQINRCYNNYYNVYLKGRHSADKSFVILDYILDGVTYRAVFAKKIDSEKDLNTKNLYLIHHSNVHLECQIDGIYTRNQSLLFLERLLNRWRYTANEVLLVVPFIGFHYPNQRDALVELWNWLEMNIDVEKTKLITRKGTFNLFKTAQDESGIPFEELERWGLLEPLIDTMNKGDMSFFQKSHAKYYVGVYDEYVEVISGSFNIHKGEYFENVSFRKYPKSFFFERYLHMFKDFSYKEVEASDYVHYMTIGNFEEKNWCIGLDELSQKYFL
ncbi:hypothetical protein NXW18_08730 [Bacteroides thetaiotaomicron]|jgi:hypothetical protein|uniref:hypothetical protein n=1 Tax=Bacteroides thetaiotaomicron TaxID=818 RepID=UPI00216672E5|nr:hypothetical protein [Bacteroides thetaiotaomicron]MCS2713620.1 hypothetical protein [Bacteroides thetaiotaomicron]MCS2873818.1 hypothetical protein [Bacteroides thetaiotaomicron]